MKRLLIAVLVFVAILGATLGAGKDERRTFLGEIADSQCALNVHSLTRSHQEMLQSKSMGGSSASCAQYCVKYLGGDFVLASKTDVFRLDDQTSASRFAGQRVKVVGILQQNTHTIRVSSIDSETTRNERLH